MVLDKIIYFSKKQQNIISAIKIEDILTSMNCPFMSALSL